MPICAALCQPCDGFLAGDRKGGWRAAPGVKQFNIAKLLAEAHCVAKQVSLSEGK